VRQRRKQLSDQVAEALTQHRQILWPRIAVPGNGNDQGNGAWILCQAGTKQIVGSHHALQLLTI
jgi:hypothetical protein